MRCRSFLLLCLLLPAVPAPVRQRDGAKVPALLRPGGGVPSLEARELDEHVLLAGVGEADQGPAEGL